MFYRKYFNGTIASSSTTKVVPYCYGITNTKTIYVNQTDVLLDAMKDVLETCGCEVVIDKTNYLIWINGLPLSLTFTSSQVMSCYFPFASSYLFSASGTSYEPFSGTDYKFYITVKGDPDGILDVYIGSYSSPATTNTSYSFSIGKGKDVRNNQDVRFVSLARSDSLYYFYKKVNEVTLVDGKTTPTTLTCGYAIGNDVDLTQSGQTIPLVENVTQNGFFKISNCFFGHSSLSRDTFYNIDGEVYYVRSDYLLVKCSNIIS